MSRWHTIRGPRFSFRLDRRVLPVLLLLALLVFAGMVLAIGTGQYPIPPLDVAKTLLGLGGKEHHFIVNVLRLPRALTGFLVGVSLGISGSILQGLTRNPLASPDVIGISSGAGLGATAVILLLPKAPWSWLPPFAFVGAFIAAMAAYLLSWKRGSSPIRLILVGIGINTVGMALINLLVSMSKTTRVAETMIWLTGSVYGRTWVHLGPMLPWLAVFLPLALLLARHLDSLNLGDDVARGLGTPVERARALLLLTSVALAGAAVATAGTVGFVGLMSAHIARRLVGNAHNGLLLIAGMVGGLLVLLADLLGRTIFAPIEIPVGVVTAAVGAPYFIYLLYRTRNI